LLPREKQSVSTKVTNVKHAYMHDEIYWQRIKNRPKYE